MQVTKPAGSQLAAVGSRAFPQGGSRMICDSTMCQSFKSASPIRSRNNFVIYSKLKHSNEAIYHFESVSLCKTVS